MRLRVFVSYSRKDAEAKARLLAQLQPLETSGRIDVWHDSELTAGEAYGIEIAERIETADLVLLLVSKAFLASEYCGLETETAMMRENARVIPVILEECDWKNRPFAQFHAVANLGDFPEYVNRVVAEMWRRVSNLRAREQGFVGREELLAQMHAAETPVLTGIDGAGKSTLALEYAHRHAEDYSILWWIRADRPTTLDSDYAALADALELPERTLADEHAIVQAVKRYLARTPRWLLVFDDAEDAASVAPYLPGGANGRAIITSRNPPRPGTGTPLQVDVLKREESVALLLAHSGTNDRAGADALAHELGDLPLALEHAAAYVERTASSFADYVEAFHTVRAGQSTIAATWKLSIDNIREVARPVLLCAFLAPDDIPRSLVSGSEGKLATNKAVAAARTYSLIRAGEEALGMHKLVQRVIRDEMSSSDRTVWTEKACVAVNSAFPMQPEDSREWRPAARLLPHVHAATEVAEDGEADSPEVAPLLNRAAMYLRHRHLTGEALEVYARAEQWIVRFRGSGDPALQPIRTNVATLRGAMGEREGVLAVYRAKLEHDRRVHGDAHVIVALDLSNLGAELLELRRPEEALPILREAEALFLRLGGGDKHLAVAKSNIGIAYQELGDLEAAAKELRAALALHEQYYGPDNARLIRTLYNLGGVEQSEAHIRRALAIAERELGSDNPETHRLRLEAAVQAARKGDLHDAALEFNQALTNTLDQYTMDRDQLAKLLLTFSEIMAQRGRPDFAKMYANMIHDIA